VRFYFLRKLDLYLGKFCNRVFPQSVFKNAHIKFIYKKIFLIKLWGLGNLAIIWPLIYKIKERYPNSSISFLTFDLNKGFLESNEAIDKIIYFKFTRNIFKMIIQAFSILVFLRKEKIDVAINFETFNFSSALFAYLTKASLRIGLNNNYEKTFYNYWIDSNPALHTTQKFLSLLKYIDISSPYSYFNFKELRGEGNGAGNILKNIGVDRFICIHPGTSINCEQGRRWKASSFSKLSNMLIEYYNMPLIFTGSKKEKSLNTVIIKGIVKRNRVFDLSGSLGIWEFIELLERGSMLISNDTGPVHLAASLGVNTATFYGQSSPERCRSLRQNSLIFYKNLKCSPCDIAGRINTKCSNNFKCLDFSPQEVFLKITEKFFMV